MYFKELLVYTWLLVIPYVVTLPPTEAQVSYRTMETQHAVRKPPIEEPGSAYTKPFRFFGWKYAATADQNYRARFQRPRSGLAAQPAAAEAFSGLRNRPVRQAGQQSYPGIALRPNIPSGFIPDGIASADFNGDGKTDWVVANGGDNNLWVYLGNGDGTYSIPSILNLQGLGPTWVVAADLRGNGRKDLIVTEGDSNSVEILLSNGNGTFLSAGLYLLPGLPTSAAVADFNKDGRPDIVVTMFGTSPIGFLPGVGDGTFGAVVLDSFGNGALELISVSVGDINQDGNLDLAVTDLDDGAAVILGHGDGTFGPDNVVAVSEPAVGLEYLAVTLGDLNEDGCPDLVTTETFSFAEVYLGNCDGTFSGPTFYGSGDVGVSVALKDVDGDGHLDVVAGSDVVVRLGDGVDAGNLLSVLKGDGRGDLSTASVFRGRPGMYALAFVNLNGASVPSILAADEGTDSLTLFTNDGTGDFGTPRGEAIGYSGGVANSPYGDILAVDINHDHLPDLLNIDLPQASPGTYQLSTALNLGNGHFAPRTLSPLYPDSFYVPGDFAVGDFRNTGNLDFIVVGPLGDTTLGGAFLAFAPNNGNGTFAPATVVTPDPARGVIGVGDFNRDGKLDFVAANTLPSGNNLQALTLFVGHGDGTFSPQPPITYGGAEDRWPVSVYVGDFNRDGKLDVMVYLYRNVTPATVNDVYVFYGNNDGSFQAPVKIFSNSDPFTVVDLNHDGIPDIVTCRFELANYPLPTPATVSVMLGLAGGGFGQPTVYDTYSGVTILPDVIGTDLGGQGFCTVGDFNGDGNLDIGVSQAEIEYFPAYTQLMSGNGDGTFTPTYNVYPFDRQTLPQTFVDLDADGKTDMLEIDGYNSSFNFIPGATGKAFQFETVTEPITGNTGSAQVSLNVPSASDTVIALTASDPGLQIPATVTIPAGTVSQQFTYTVTNGANVHRAFRISAVLGSEQEDVYNFVQTDQRVLTGFSFGLNYPTGSVYAGFASSDYQPSYGTQPNYSTTLQFSCTGLPPGLTCDFKPASVELNSNQERFSSMFVDATAGAVPGTYSFEAVASDSNSAISYPASVTVYGPAPDLHVTGPSMENGTANTPMQVQFTITNNGDAPAHNTVATGGFSQYGQTQNLVGLTSSVGTCDVSSRTCSLGTMNVGDQIAVIITFVPTFPTNMAAALGVTESEHDVHPIDNFINVPITADDYSMSLSPSSLTISPGSQGTATVTLQPQSSDGFNMPVSLSCSGLPSGATCSFAPPTLTPGTLPATSVLTVTIPHTTAMVPSLPKVHSGALLAQFFVPIGAFLLLPAGKKRTGIRVISGTAVLVVILILQACGGSGGSSGNSGSGTTGTTGGGTTPPPSTYSVNVTANGGGDQHMAKLTLKVQ